jgi:hypothetical protein
MFFFLFVLEEHLLQWDLMEERFPVQLLQFMERTV